MTRVPAEGELSRPLEVPQWSLRVPEWISTPPAEPRIRLLIDNDFAADPDDLFQIVHHLLSPSMDIRGIICTRGAPEADGPDTTAADSLLVMRDVFRRMGIVDDELLLLGSASALADSGGAARSPAVEAILAEVRRDDDRRLFYAAGGGLTEVAAAYLEDPSIVDRLTLVWIGGLQHDDVVGTPGRYSFEYNRDVDLRAAQIVFSAGFDIWQVPRDVYRKSLMSMAEIRARVASTGPLGAYLHDEIRHVLDNLRPAIGPAEMYPMGDQPLVLLTVLQGNVDLADDFGSSEYVVKPAPGISDEGLYVHQAEAPPMRVYTSLDQRLMFEDFYLKLGEFASWQASSPSGRLSDGERYRFVPTEA